MSIGAGTISARNMQRRQLLLRTAGELLLKDPSSQRTSKDDHDLEAAASDLAAHELLTSRKAFDCLGFKP